MVRGEGHSQPDPVPREPVEVYPEAGTWELVLAGVGTALLVGGVLFLLVTVSAGCWESPLPAAEMRLLQGWDPLSPRGRGAGSSHALWYPPVVTSRGGAVLMLRLRAGRGS